MSKNKYRNPERDAYYENLEKELKEKINTERTEVVLKNSGFTVIDEKKVEDTPSGEEETWKKRYGDLQRHVENLKREWSSKEAEYQAEINRLNEATKAPELPTTLNDEKIAEWEKKFPDVAAIIDYKAQKRAKEIASGLEQKVTVLEENKKMLDHQRAYLQLLSIHEDYDEIRQSEEFRDWLAEQDDDFQSAIMSPKDYSEKSVQKAARVVDFFKLETGWGKAEKKDTPRVRDTSAAKTVPSRGTTPDDYGDQPRFSESQIAKMSSKEFEMHKDAILAAQRKGPPFFVFDITGAAR